MDSHYTVSCSFRTWTHTDLCYVPEVPSFNISLVDGVSETKASEKGGIGEEV